MEIPEGNSYILTLLHNQNFHRVQKAIINGLNSVFLCRKQDDSFLQNDVINNLEKMIYSWTIYSKDIIAICLLAYGNCLLELYDRKMTYNISDKMKDMLNIISKTSFPEIISIRATFCLSFIEQSSFVNFNITLNWFKNKWNLTSKEIYNILLNQTLYGLRDNTLILCVTQFIEYLDKNSNDFMDMFVIDLYNYLCDNNRRNYLSDPVPDYIRLALKFTENDQNKLRNAIEKSSFGEKEFKTKLSLYHMNNPRDKFYSTLLYTYFGILTDELINMLERFGDNRTYRIHNPLSRIKQVSNRNVIEKFFQTMDLNMPGENFESHLNALKSFAKIHDISRFEIYQRISRINNMSYDDDDDEWCKHKQDIFNFLLDISCFENEKIKWDVKKTLTTIDNIDEEFRKEIEYLDKKSALFFRENPFLIDYTSVSNSSN